MLHYFLADTQDQFFENVHILDKNLIKHTPLSIEKMKVYIDQNAISNIRKKKEFRDNFIAFAEKSNYSFVYSAYLIEDAINKNPIGMDEYIETLEAITNECVVAITENGLTTVKEKLNDTLNRVKEYRELTKLGELNFFLSAFKNHYMNPCFRKGGAVNNLIKDDFLKFIRNNLTDDVRNRLEVEFCGDEILSYFIKNGELLPQHIEDKQSAIDSLFCLLDFLNYKAENISFSNKAKICSSFRDQQHLKHAYICDYFITEDKNLILRGELIYSLIGAKTKFISLKEFYETYVIPIRNSLKT